MKDSPTACKRKEISPQVFCIRCKIVTVHKAWLLRESLHNPAVRWNEQLMQYGEGCGRRGNLLGPMDMCCWEDACKHRSRQTKKLFSAFLNTQMHGSGEIRSGIVLERFSSPPAESLFLWFSCCRGALGSHGQSKG